MGDGTIGILGAPKHMRAVVVSGAHTSAAVNVQTDHLRSHAVSRVDNTFSKTQKKHLRDVSYYSVVVHTLARRAGTRSKAFGGAVVREPGCFPTARAGGVVS